ncbi:scavenger receptor cysteine-rich domain-containing protein DMBT1-like [Argopecten irradians]|uniref:scavenger receptor cysteine-rich domain-containing protein DMBT1-like n=1 Tax=Argopecten irradians TaxID=31199 RepID=UPI0037152985
MRANIVWPLVILLQVQIYLSSASCSSTTVSLTAHLDYSGQIKSPNYPYNYNNRASCRWLITAATGRVFLSFEEMNLETNYDYIGVYDGDSPSATRYGRYSSTQKVQIISSGSNFFVWFTSDHSVTRTGFKITYFALYPSSSSNLHAWPTSGCGSPTTVNINTNDIQQLKLPAGPDGTNPAINNCEVKFTVTSGNLNVTILWSDLDFTSNDLNVTSTNHCNQQYGLSVWDDTGSTLLYWLCNSNQHPDDSLVIYPTQTTVLFRYNTNGNTRGPVISVQSYAGTAATETVPVLTTQSVVATCGSTSLLAESYQKYITSPLYPGQYTNNLDCTWILSASSSDSAITLTIIILYTELSHDTLTVYDGPSTSYPTLGSSYSGFVSNVQLISSSSFVTLYFTTDSSIVNTGFYVNYISSTRALPSCASLYSSLVTVNASSTQATIYSHPGYPSLSYDNSFSQYWLIRKPDSSQTLYLYFTAFRLESCNYDTLKIYQGACVTDTLLHVLCGAIDLSEQYKISLGSYVLLHFQTDGSVTYKGFDLRYQIGSDSDDDNVGINVPLAAIIVPIIAGAVIIAIVCRVLTIRKAAKKPTAKVSPPNINTYNLKLTKTTKEKIPKQKPVRKKQDPAPPPAFPRPQKIAPVPPGPAPPPHPQDPAYPPIPPLNGPGSVPPMHNTYNPHLKPVPAEVPNPFVYTPPY